MPANKNAVAEQHKRLQERLKRPTQLSLKNKVKAKLLRRNAT